MHIELEVRVNYANVYRSKLLSCHFPARTAINEVFKLERTPTCTRFEQSASRTEVSAELTCFAES